jgi:hypothetical protein
VPVVEPAVGIDAGAAWSELLGRHGHGRVLATFRRGVYVEMEGEIDGDADDGTDDDRHRVVALTSIDVPPGPLHLRVDPLPRPAVGDVVTVAPATLDVAGVAVELDGLHPWRPRALDAALLRHHAAAARRTLGPFRSDLAGHSAVTSAVAALDGGDLSGVVVLLSGLGSGLTPAGDDVLAGLFVVLAAAGVDQGMLTEAAAGARTHAISRAFLRWAARGQAVEPVHLLLGALASSDRAGACAHQQAVLALGHTSGADLLLGLRLGLDALAAQNGRSANQMAFVGLPPGLCQR